MHIKSILGRFTGKTYAGTTFTKDRNAPDADPEETQVKLTESDFRALFHTALMEKQKDLPVRRAMDKQP